GTIPSLAPGASSTLTVKATVGTSTPLGNLRNNACAVATSSNQACDWDDTTIDKQTKPVLTITKDDQQGDVKLGQNLTYDIVVRNTGDGAAKSVVVSDPLPAGLDFVSGSGPAGITVTASGRNVTADLGDLAAGQSVTLKVNAKVNQSAAPGALSNQACAAASNAANVCATDTDTVKREFFQYTFNSNPTDPQPGQAVTYRMEFGNNGNVDSANAEIEYALAGVLDDSTWNPSSVTANSGTVVVSGNTIDWKGPLASGQTVVITFTGVWNGNGDGFAFPGVTYYGSAR
ncbi:isopeptide-forming domain-containing fimbrial protein, partial [Microbacterium sp. H6]